MTEVADARILNGNLQVPFQGDLLAPNSTRLAGAPAASILPGYHIRRR